MSKLESAACWIPARSGVLDFDGPVVSISSRMYSRGVSGGKMFVMTDLGLEPVPPDMSIPPAASSSLVLHVPGRTIAIAEQDFTGEDESKIEAQVEAWADQMFERVLKALKAEFKDFNPV